MKKLKYIINIILTGILIGFMAFIFINQSLKTEPNRDIGHDVIVSGGLARIEEI